MKTLYFIISAIQYLFATVSTFLRSSALVAHIAFTLPAPSPTALRLDQDIHLSPKRGRPEALVFNTSRGAAAQPTFWTMVA